MRAQFVMLGVIAFAAMACNEEGGVAPTRLGAKVAVVYEAGPHLVQCEPPVLTPALSAAKLTAAGVAVQRSGCGQRTGVMYPAMCGAGLGEIIVHDIPSGQLAAAKAAGFVSVDDIGGWERTRCADDLLAIEVARGTTSCVGIRNRVLLLQDLGKDNQRVVLLDQAGNCADASYRQVLYGGDDGGKVLCSNADSIAGARKDCPVASYTALFDTILANLDAPDLGLGSGFGVQQVYPAP
jgi:hypothetical protein